MKELGKTFIGAMVYGLVAGISVMAGYKLWDEVIEDEVDELNYLGFKDYLAKKFNK